MAIEIERKFLVLNDRLPLLKDGENITQGYFATRENQTVRIRMGEQGCFLTIKGPPCDEGLSRSEFEYEIPFQDAKAMLSEFCGGRTIQKTRYRLSHGELLWEVDVFEQSNAGLVLAEVELDHPHRVVDLPMWIGQDVTGEERYSNR
ncbi:MAG: CYTH domain-containing protein, partial [Spirochaetales bacterium]|nr:CYTH domain-containing protein [Spirochaetales bacterium]